MPVIEIITIVFAAITIYLCYDEYKKGKMSLRNFKIVSICESLAILGMIFLIICCYSNMKWLNHKFCGISDSSRSSVGSYRIASERNIRHQDIRIPVCEES